MKGPVNATKRLLSRASKDHEFRDRLAADPKGAIEKEFGVTLAENHEIHVHEETEAATHLVLPPKSRFSEEEREAARTGAASLEFLRKTMHDPAPPIRPPEPEIAASGVSALTTEAVASAGRESIRLGIEFLESTIDENGAWHCIRFNTADPGIPRHFERPPFVSAFCVLALESSNEAQARSMCAATRAYLADTMEYPGFWRYYRHLPQDLDSTALCSLVIGTHPWVLLGRNVSRILANRDEKGCFMTWVLGEDEPDVVSIFRIEADPVVNANVIAFLGDHPDTRAAQRWLESMITEDRLEGSSKWYPDEVAIYYATTRAMIRAQPALEKLGPTIADRILGLRDPQGEFGNILQTAQALSALYNIGSLDRIDAKREVERLLSSQREDGSWPELLAFGDQSLMWGTVGQIGHGSESVTSAFCIEALERLVETLENTG
ncbi:MAG: hypothetical protein OXQ29_24295 [Rhodospirillaceae bacterium]|nr:hypothetical protein [Rhodospirillaceae bacterium]